MKMDYLTASNKNKNIYKKCEKSVWNDDRLECCARKRGIEYEVSVQQLFAMYNNPQLNGEGYYKRRMGLSNAIILFR